MTRLIRIVAIGGMICTAQAPLQAGILDTVSGASAAYSLRKLSDGYTDSAIQVRRSSDDTTQDIGFDIGGDLDTAALLTFVGSGNGYVTKWYDQSGNSYDLANATAVDQPQIVAAGNVLTAANGKTAVRYAGSEALYVLESLYDANTLFCVGQFTQSTGSGNLLERRLWSMTLGDGATRLALGGDNDKLAIAYNAGSFTLKATDYALAFDQVLLSTLAVDSSQSGNNDWYELYANGSSVNSGSSLSLTANEDALILGAQTASGMRGLQGYVQEMIIYPSVLDQTDRTTVDSDLMLAYTAIPEPGTWILLATGGMLGLVSHIRRRRAVLRQGDRASNPFPP